MRLCFCRDGLADCTCLSVSYSGQAGEVGPGKSKYPRIIRFALHFFRFPIFISLVMAIVGACMMFRACEIAGSIIFIISFISFCGFIGVLAMRHRVYLTQAGSHGVLLTLAALPFLATRIVHFLLGEYGLTWFKQITYDSGIAVDVGLVMEVIVSIIMLTARMVIEPIWSVRSGYERIPSQEPAWS